MSKNLCPNCGRNPPRSEGAILCQMCFDTCPMGPEVAKNMEETFRFIMESGVKMPQELPRK